MIRTSTRYCIKSYNYKHMCVERGSTFAKPLAQGLKLELQMAKFIKCSLHGIPEQRVGTP